MTENQMPRGLGLTKLACLTGLFLTVAALALDHVALGAGQNATPGRLVPPAAQQLFQMPPEMDQILTTVTTLEKQVAQLQSQLAAMGQSLSATAVEQARINTNVSNFAAGTQAQISDLQKRVAAICFMYTKTNSSPGPGLAGFAWANCTAAGWDNSMLPLLNTPFGGH